VRWLEIVAQEPLLIGEVKPGTQFLSSLAYIPGRVLRGAWAEWLVRRGRGEEIRERVRQVRIGNFFPVEESGPVTYVSPFLFSMTGCKREGGFCTDPAGKKLPFEEPAHGMVDVLLPWLAYHLLEKAGGKLAVPFLVFCRKCGDRMEGETGFFFRRDGMQRLYGKTIPGHHAQTRAALSRYRRAVQEEMLYTATALTGRKGKLSFIGRLFGPEELCEEIITALGEIPLGGMRSRGYGQVEARETSCRLPSLTERVELFNIKLAECWRDLRRLATDTGCLPEEPKGTFFSVDLLSPGIFRHRGVPVLAPALEIGGKVLEPVFWLTRPGFAGGWSEAWGLPKRTSLAAQMGSVYVFQWEGGKDELLSELERLETYGVGERTEESYGECWICHPFHLEVEEV
jgi:CRISPR-associated protein Csx10